MAENKSIYDLSDISKTLTNQSEDGDLPKLGSKSIYDFSDIGTQQGQTETDKEYWFEGDNFASNLAEGFTIGGRGLIAGFNYILAQTEDNPLKKYELTQWADNYIKESPKSDGSVGQWVGQLVPSVIPTAGAVITSMIPSGQPIAGALGTLGISALATSSAGMGLKRYDDEKLAIGENPYDNPIERLAVASLYGASEYFFERIALSKFLPKPIKETLKNTGGKLTFGGNKIDPKVATDVFANFISKNKSKVKKYAKLGNIEGFTEVGTQISQDMTDWFFMESQKDKEFSKIVQEGVSSSAEAYLGGFLMGTGVGTLSFKAQDINNQRRREAQGDVFLTEYNGESHEVLTKNEKTKKVTLLNAQGEIENVNDSEIGDILSVSNKQFENILNAKETDQILEDEIYVLNKNIELQTEKETYKELEKFVDSKGGTVDQNGNKVYTVVDVKGTNFVITKPQEKGSKTAYGFELDAFTETADQTPIVPINVDLISDNIKIWNKNEIVDLIGDIQKENAKVELGIKNPVKGQTIIIEDQIFDVLGTREGVVNLKNQDTDEDAQITKQEYDTIKQTEVKRTSKVSIGDINVNEDGTLNKPKVSDVDLPVFIIGGQNVKVTEMNDKKEMTLGKTFKTKAKAEETAKNMTEMYSSLQFEVVDNTDKSDMFAVNNFILKAKPKINAIQEKNQKPIETRETVKTKKVTKKEATKTTDETKTKKNVSQKTEKKTVITKDKIKGKITKKRDIKFSKEFQDNNPHIDPIDDAGMFYTRQIEPYIKNNVKRVEAVAKRITGSWKKAPKIKVVQSHMDFINNYAINNGIDQNTKAFYDPSTNEIVFIANKFIGKLNSDIQKTLYHETVGHQGLKGMMSDKEFNNLLDNVYNDVIPNDKLANQIAYSYFHKPLDVNLEYDPKVNYIEAFKPNNEPLSLNETRELAEEYIAHKVEDSSFSKDANKMVGIFKSSISDLTGIDFKLNNNDIKRIIASSTQFIESGGNLYNKNIIKYSLSNKYNKPFSNDGLTQENKEWLDTIKQSRNLKRGDDINNGIHRPELIKKVKKLTQDDFNIILKGQVVEPVLYDLLTTGDTSIYNPVFDFSTDMKGLKGGFNNLFLKENVKNNVVASFTDIGRLTSTIEQLKNKKVNYLTYVLTGTGNNLVANLDFRKAMFGSGGFTQKVIDNGVDFIEFKDDFINRARGLKQIDKTLDELSDIKSVKTFGNAIIEMPFDKFQMIADKIFPKTVGTPSVNIMQTKYGFPTKDSVIGSLGDPMFSKARGGDIVAVSKPDYTTIYVNESEYKKKGKDFFTKYKNMGYEVNVLPKEAEHPSYPYALGGEATGVLNQFQNFADIYTKLDKEGNIEAIPKDSNNPNYYLRRSSKLIDRFKSYKSTNRNPSESPFVTQKISVSPIRYFDQYIKDIVKGENVKASDVVSIINKRDFNSYRKSIVDTSALFGLKVSNVTNNVGIRDKSLQYANLVDLKGTKEDIRAYAIALATIKENQKQVIISQVKEGADNTNIEMYLKKGVDIDKIIDSAKKNNILNANFDVNLNKFSIFGVGKDLSNNVQNFLKEQSKNVKKFEHQESESQTIKEGEYKELLEKYRLSKHNQGKIGSDLNQFIKSLISVKDTLQVSDNKLRQSRDIPNRLNYNENYQNNLHTNILGFLKRYHNDTNTPRQWLNILFGNTDLTVQDLKWMGLYNRMMDKNRVLTRNNVYDIFAESKVKTIDLDPNSNVKNILVTTDYKNGDILDKNGFNYFRAFTKFPVVSEIQAKVIKNGEYDIIKINKIKGNEEIALKELIKQSNYNDIFAIAYENKRLLNNFKTKYDFKAIVDKVKLRGKEYGLLIISPKLKEQSRGDMGLRYQRDLPQGFDEQNTFKKWANQSVYNIQDKMVYLKNLQDYAETKGYKVKDENNAYVKENLSKGKIQEKTDKFYSEKFMPLLQHINGITKKGRVKYNDVSDYVYALHSRERRKYVDPGMSITEQEGIIKDFESKVSAKERKTLIGFIKDINKFNVQESYDSGLLTKDNFNRFYPREGKSKTAMFDFYVPLRGFEESEFDNTAFSSIMMKAKGRKSKADDPIAYLYVMAQSSIIQGENNKVKRSLLNFVREFPDNRMYEIKNVYYDISNEKSINEVNVKPSNEYKLALTPFKDAITKEIIKMQGQDSMIPVVENGKKKYITFYGDEGKKIAQGFKGLKPWNIPFVTYFTQKLRQFTTQYSPEFIPINFIRDISAGMINIKNDFGNKVSKDVMMDTYNSFKTLKSFYKDNKMPQGEEGEMLNQFILNGTKTGYSNLKTVDEIKKDIEKVSKSMNSTDTQGFKKLVDYAIGGVNKAGSYLDTWNMVLENTVRFSAFKKLIKMGKTLDEASIYSKDLTVNFNRKGMISNRINGLYLFFNAGVQGVERLSRPIIRDAKESKGVLDFAVKSKTLHNYFLTLPAIGLITQMLSRIGAGEDEDDKYYYDKLPEYVRTHNLVLPNPLTLFASDEEKKKMNTRDMFLTIPLPYGHNVFFSLPDSAVRSILKVETPEKAVINTMLTMTESFSPLGSFNIENRTMGEALQRYAVPTVAKPALDLAQNKNFIGSPIYRDDSPYSKTKTPFSQMYFDSVSPVYKAFTDFVHNGTGGNEVEEGIIELNPEVIEYGVQSLTGGLGTTINKSIGLVYLLGKQALGYDVVKKENDKMLGSINVGPIRNIPYLRRFVNEVSYYTPVSDYYEIKEKINDITGKRKTYLDGIKDGLPLRAEYKKFVNDPENKKWLKLENRLKYTDKVVKNLRDKKNIFKSREDEQKVEQIERRIREEYKKFNKFVNVKELRTLDDIMSFIQE